MDNKLYKKRVLIIGVPDMAYIGTDVLYNAGINIVGVLGPLKTHNTYDAFKNFIKARQLNFIEYDNLNSPELHKTVSELKVDIAVVFSFNNKIPISFINLIKDGILNLHPSLLPQYRGGNPYSRVIMNGEKETGVTVHFMSENFDEGDIVAQIKCQLDENETMGTIFNKTNYLGTQLMLSVLKEYENNPLKRIPQPIGEFKKANNLKSEEFFIDFNKSAIDIERQIRALNPFFNCYTYYKGQVLKIYKASVIEETIENDFRAGEIVRIENDKIYIKTGKGYLCPEIVQFGVLFTGDATDFINVAKPKVKDIVGMG